ncbi:MAG TPA: hypothetical protein PKH77_24505 [Anaerolineae bacterium]|nr:hypothetical protein [Anaerolineae bacterium]
MRKETRHLRIFLIGALLRTWAFYFPIGILQLDWFGRIGLALFIVGGPTPSFMGLIVGFTTYIA